MKYIVLLGFLFSFLYAEYKPSWCKYAKTKIEKKVCNSPDLIHLENKLTKLYFNIRNSTVNREHIRKILKDQRSWIKKRNRVCRSANISCIKQFYFNRIKQLNKLVNKTNEFITFSNLDEIINKENNIVKLHNSNLKTVPLTKIKTMINQKHTKSISIYIELSNKIVTYSIKEATLKIWDKKTNRLLKTFRSLFDISKIYFYKEQLYFWSRYTLYQVDLNKLNINKLVKNIRPIDKLIFFDNLIISGVNSSLGAKYNNINLLIYDKTKKKLSIKTIYECPYTNCNYTLFKIDSTLSYYYVNVNEDLLKISITTLKEKKISTYKKRFLSSQAKEYSEKTSNFKVSNLFIDRDNKIIKYKNSNHPKKAPYTKAINECDNTCILFNGKKIHCAVAQCGSGAYDSEFKNSIYTTANNIMIVPGFIGTSIGNDIKSYEKTGLYFYIINSEGKLLRRINRKVSLMESQGEINKDTLHIYDDKNYIVYKHSLELLDDNFSMKSVIYNTLSKHIVYIQRTDSELKIYYKSNIIQVFNIKTKKEIYRKYIFNKNSYMIVTKEGFFSGKGNFEKYIHFIDKNYKVYLINQFYDHFFRPDLVKLKLQGKEKEYQKAIKGMTYQEALKNPPPKIEFVGIDGKQVKKDGFEYSVVKTAKDRVKLSFNIKQNQNGGVGIIRVYQEGKLIQTIGKGKINKQSANIDAIVEQEELDKKAKQEQKEYLADATKAIDKNRTIDDTIYKIKDTTLQNKEGVYSIELELKSGNNEIAVEAFNKTNTVTSFRESINIKANIPKQEPKLYAIVCGVNEFEHNNKKLKLKYSVNDAKAIKELLLKNSKKLYKDIEVKYLTEQNLTKENINKAIEDIKQKAKLEDTILFFISTHGRAYKGNLYLLPYNNKKGKDWLRFSELFNKLQSIKSLNQIYIVDACESGKANDIVSSVYDSRASILAKSAGVHILLATTKGTYAFESQDANIKNSVFTAKILKALNNKKTDKNKDNIISIKELSNSLKEKLNTEHQYPVIRNVGKDIGLEKL